MAQSRKSNRINSITGSYSTSTSRYIQPARYITATQYNTVSTIKKYCNPKLETLGIVLTRYNGRAIISRELAELISSTAKKLQTKAYTTKIRECIYTYSSKSNTASDYTALLNEAMTEV